MTTVNPKSQEVEARLDDLFLRAFNDANHPAMLDWVEVKFLLKRYRTLCDQTEATEERHGAALSSSLHDVTRLGELIPLVDSRDPQKNMEGINGLLELQKSITMRMVSSAPPGVASVEALAPLVIALKDIAGMSDTVGYDSGHAGISATAAKALAYARKMHWIK